MANPSPLLACLIAAALAAGCVSDQAPPVGSDDPGSAQAPEGSQAGSPASHGSPRRDEGTVDVQPEGGQFVARRTVTIDNDFGGASQSTILVTAFNGGITVEPSRDGGYHLTAELYGRGSTEDEARAALDLLNLENGDDLRQGTLDLSFTLTSDPMPPARLPLPIGLPSGVSNGGALQLAVPPEPAHDLEAGTSNGGVGISGLHGPHLKAGSSNGGVDVRGAFDSVEAGTSNGAIDLQGTFNDVDASTSNGRISADLRPTRSGEVGMSTSNGRIEVELPRDDSAFDITASTSNGDITFDLEGRESEEDDHASFRSEDWSSAEVQVAIDLSTSNGSISVRD